MKHQQRCCRSCRSVSLLSLCLHDHCRDSLYVLVCLSGEAAHEVKLQVEPSGAERAFKGPDVCSSVNGSLFITALSLVCNLRSRRYVSLIFDRPYHPRASPRLPDPTRRRLRERGLFFFGRISLLVKFIMKISEGRNKY